MATEYPVNLKLTLTPIENPWVKIAVPGKQIQVQLTKQTEFEFDFVAKDCAELTVEHYNKAHNDPTTAVEISGIEFFGIRDPKFVWSGVYRPVYPEPWFSQQSTKPRSELSGFSHLGWNGTYSLKFTVPVFTWIHQVQNLGWIYQ